MIFLAQAHSFPVQLVMKISIRKTANVLIDAVRVPSMFRGPFRIAFLRARPSQQVGRHDTRQLCQSADEAADSAEPGHESTFGFASPRFGTTQTRSVLTSPAIDM